MSIELIFALACGILALVYGMVSVKWILAKPAGTDRMQEIAGAIQEGAKAYLNRQYMTIGMAGIVLFVIVGVFLDWATASGFPEDYIRRKWDEGYDLTALTYGDGEWVVVVSRGTGYTTQSWAMRAQFR